MNYLEKRKMLFKERTYELAALIAIKYGGKRLDAKNYKYDYIQELWKYGHPHPHLTTINIKIKIGEVKWFIHNKLNYPEGDIWNSDFLMGLTNHGVLKWNYRCYPSFRWYNNDSVRGLVCSSPYGGIIYKNLWKNVPAFYLKYSENSLSYLAGVMAGAQLVEEDGYQYAKFNEKSGQVVCKMGIPIDKNYSLGLGKYYLISPIWPALFSIKMPEEVGKKWLGLKKPYGINCYAPVLWKTYGDSRFPKGGIPYLKSRRAIFYRYECEEGAIKRIEKMRVDKGMTEMDNRVKEIVQMWVKKTV